MIILDQNSYDLLAYLLKLDEPETVMTISKVLGQSRRKVYYHIDKINEALPADLPKIISYPRIGIVLSPEQKSACQELLAGLDDYSYVMSVQERLLLSITYIAIAEERVTIDKLIKLNAVSRNTVLNDLQEIRRQLAQETYPISLETSKAKGYCLVCHPLAKMQYLNRLLHNIYTGNNPGFLCIVRDKLEQASGQSLYLSDRILDFLDLELTKLQKALGKKINPIDVQFMKETLPYHLLSYHNLQLTPSEKMDLKREFYLIKQRKEYGLAQQLMTHLAEAFSLESDEIETCLVTVLLLSYRKDRDSHLESHDYDEMRQVIEAFLARFELDFQVSFMHKQLLVNQLLTHCKALIFRKTYGILTHNPLTQQIKENYAQLFAMTRACSPILEEAWFIKLTDDDLAYLTIHIGGELSYSQRKPIAPSKLALVCDEGVGVQKLFMQQCSHYLPHSKIEAVLTTEQFQSVLDIIDVDLVISTNDSLDCPLPILYVHSILRDDDAIKLLRFAKQQGQAGSGDFSQDLERLIHPYVKDEKDAYVLKTKIERLINQELLFDSEGKADGI